MPVNRGTARLHISDDRSTFRMHTPYVGEFVKAFKEQVDPNSRKWDPRSKIWVVDMAYFDLVTRLLEKHGLRLASKSPPYPGRVDDGDFFVDDDERTPSPGSSGPSPRTIFEGMSPQELYEYMMKSSAPHRAFPQSVWDDLQSRQWTNTPIRFPVEPEPTTGEKWREVVARLAQLERENDTLLEKLDTANRTGSDWKRRYLEKLDETRRLNIEVLRLTRELFSHSFAGASFNQSASGPYAVLGLAPDAPDYVIEAAWKAVMIKEHPDKGGDLAKAQAANHAHDQIIEQRKR